MTSPEARLPSVWIVDDSPLESAMTERALGSDAQVLRFADGFALIEHLSKHAALPDIVVLDWEMPGMNGLEVCRFLRQRHDHLELPVLMLTSHRANADVVAGLAAGANDFVGKPFDAGELVSRARGLVNLKRLHDDGKTADARSRLQTEDALRVSEVLHRRLAETAMIGVCQWNASGDLVEGNDEFLRIVGASRDDLRRGDVKWAALTPPEDRLLDASAAAQIARDGSCKPYEKRCVTADGRTVPILIGAAPADDDNGGGVAFVVDLTDKRRAEDALRESERGYAILLDSIADGVIATDTFGLVTRMNPVAQKFTGCTLLEAKGRPLREVFRIVDKDTGDELPSPIGEVLRVGDVVDLPDTAELVAKDATRRPVSIRASPIRGESGEAVGVVMVLHDTSAQRDARQALVRTNAITEAAFLTKSRFFANMSHEIRTPMNGVIGMTGLLLDGALAPEQREQAEIIRRSGEALLAIVNDILDFSKLEAGKMRLEEIDFDLRACLTDVENLVAPMAREKGLTFATIIAPQTPAQVRGDPGRLRQVVLNLVTNAIKFTKHGSVTVRASAVTTGDGHDVDVQVEDTGMGIPAARIDHLFQPFSQVDESTTRRFGGTGLGLAISRAIVDAMGGALEVTSTEGTGSQFRLVVRLRTAVAVTVLRPVLVDGDPVALVSSSGRVLVVDDNVVNQKVAVQLLTRAGYKCDVAGDGREALQALALVPYDVILMDCHMPEMDGLEATRAIRALTTRQRSTPIIAMTADALDGFRERCFASGMNAYLAKPIMRGELLALVGTLISPQIALRQSAPVRAA